MATTASTTNGVPAAAATVGGNRKKQKRRAKQQAKAATHPPGVASPSGHAGELDYDEDAMAYDEDEDDYDDEADFDIIDDAAYPPLMRRPNGMHPPPVPSSSGKSNKKKKKSGVGGHEHSLYDPSLLPPLPNPPSHSSGALRSVHQSGHSHASSLPLHANIWNTSTQQERQNIKDFWLSLSEDERKSLLKIEKEAVLKKMKQQQKHSCSCTVCGRKRTAIEEELENLYEGYYEELEQYAHHDHPPLPAPISDGGMLPEPLHHHHRPPHPLAEPPPPNPQHRTSALREHLDEDDYSEDEEGYSDEDEEYSDEDLRDQGRGGGGGNAGGGGGGVGVPDFFNFGQNLTVKGILTPWLEKLQSGLKGQADNLLTVADDLLKNDGRKFIEMMEQLAERRMQRESDAEYAAANPSHALAYPPNDPAYHHEDPLAAGEEFDDDEERSYDSQDEFDDELEEEDEMGGLTEEQRVQEGRRMFQIFAARMFEQRVLNAYKEKVAAERQQRLLEELEDESKLSAQREAKKQRDAQKKKDKKKQQQQAKAEEKAKREAEKEAEEARIREAEEEKLEEQRRKKEEQRKKKEDEKRRQDEERSKKEAEKLRRQQEEQQRREEVERKAREQKAAEKAKKDEARKRERDDREAKEKEVRDKKVQEDREKKDREAKERADQDARQRERTAQQHPPLQIQKRPSQMGMVAIPGVYPKPTASAISSPHPSIPLPAIPKAPTPAVKPRQTSQQGSHASSPKQPHSQISSAPSKSSSPGSTVALQQQPQQPVNAHPKQIMQKPGNQHHPHPAMQATSPLHQQPLQPPPGMTHAPLQQQHQLQHQNAMPPPSMGFQGYQGFQGPHGPIMHSNMGQRGPMPVYQHPGPAMGVPNRMSFGPPINGMPAPPPPGMMSPPTRGMTYPFEAPSVGQPPPGFGMLQQQQQLNHTPPLSQPPSLPTSSIIEAPRQNLPSHSRHVSLDKDRFAPAAASNQAIARPHPIQRPSSAKPHSYDDRRGSNTDLDDLSAHLGSSALLADDDEPEPLSLSAADSRRQSNIPAGARNISSVISAFGSGPPGAVGFAAGNSNGWNPPFGGPTPTLSSQQSWGAASNNSSAWSQNQTAFSSNAVSSAFGAALPLGHHRSTAAGLNRPLTIRLAVCQACKQLSHAARTTNKVGEVDDEFHPIAALLRQIDANRPLLDSPPTLREIEEICETEGDSQNGGGELLVRRAADGGTVVAVRWAPDQGTPGDLARGSAGGLGEIGSPLPSKSSPAGLGFGAPGMGRAGNVAGTGTVQSGQMFPGLGALGVLGIGPGF